MKEREESSVTVFMFMHLLCLIIILSLFIGMGGVRARADLLLPSFILTVLRRVHFITLVQWVGSGSGNGF